MHRFTLHASFRLLVAMLFLGAAPGLAADRENVKERAWVKSHRASAAEMIAKLDMTSFPNSIGPRRVAGKVTLAQYGFTRRSAFDDGWGYAKMADGSWEFGIFVLTDGARAKQLCVTDSAVGGGTYRATTAVEVARRSDGIWHSVQVLAHVVGCG